ncbi:hypothetical protein K458DRAFT_419684 [Lentithecium fluviatile CBS 122367]|uniref:Uncharacterized protein n=1 Tax=Lentithecium fluviatile CBS 122367 TaxID=1168545 RepID=A0A6G1IX75_9PLEO|nr:hypothetical protein K458DRAFT_419684 [Lentithecium fluviatile CBS 122367]
MPALLVDTSTRSTSPSSSSTPSDQRDRRRSASRSPGRPPVSPITPTSSVAQLAPLEPAEPRTRVVPPPPPVATFRQQPPSVSIAESENPDAIALRSAISLLQLQREKSRRDLKALEELKAAAVSNPQTFVRSLQEQQKSQASKPKGNILSPTLSDISEAALKERNDGGEDHNEAARKDSAGVEGLATERTKFPPIPEPQNIIRCPPVNWAKYHVVGESLDKMHEEQRRYPGSTEPPRTQQGTKAPPHAVAAPYSPFTDGVGDPQSTPQPWQRFKKSPS